MSFIDEDYVNIVPQDLLERGIRLREELGFYEICYRAFKTIVSCI